MLTADSRYDSLLAGGEIIMAALITHDHLKEIVTAGQIVIGGDPTAVEGIKYDFRLGSKFLKASLERPVAYNDLHGTETLKAKIEPGEVVFVMSEERLKLPMDMFVFLVPKRKISHDGIAIMGGLCVDPGYDGHCLLVYTIFLQVHSSLSQVVS
jgi:deoxycytidine triphosphate deaminase